MANKPERTGFFNPQQILFFEHYLNPEGECFNNVHQSALKAGYAEGTTNKIVEKEWYKGHMRRLSMAIRGEEVLLDMLNMKVETVVRVTPTGDEIIGVNPALVKIKQDTAKFAVERLNKERWATRTEVTGPEGIPLVSDELKKKADQAINDYINERSIK